MISPPAPPPFPRSVLMTADVVGGVWTYALELVSVLGRRGVRVVLATMGGHPDRSQCRAVLGLPGVTLAGSDFRLEWMDDPWDDVEAAGEWLLELERSHRPDVVHLNGYAHATLPFRAPCLVMGHSCVASWYAAVRGHPPGRRWELYGQKVAAGLAAADLVSAPTRAMLDALAHHHGEFRAGPVVPNGRSPARFRPRLKAPLVLCAARVWDEAKNVTALDRAAAEVPWPVLVAGEQEGPAGERVELQHARGLGRLPPGEVAGWMGRASIYALPALYEPFGLSALEAAHCGCALVLGDIPSLRETWDGAAAFVEPRDAEALAWTLRRLASRPDLRAELSLRARARAASYTPDTMADAWSALAARLAPKAVPVSSAGNVA